MYICTTFTVYEEYKKLELSDGLELHQLRYNAYNKIKY